MNSQMIFQRYELKYRITREQMACIKAAMSAYMVPDEYGRSLIQSLYYDTPDHRLIRRSLEHPVYKEKLRLRSYGVAQKDSHVYLELKKKYQSVVYKRRMQLTQAQAETYLAGGACPAASQIAREIDYALHFYPELAPKILIQCQREAFYGKNDHEFRVTFDDNLMWRDNDLSLSAGGDGKELIHPGEVLMEIKTAGAIPLWMTRLLTHHCIYKTSFSKYGTAYQMICQKGEYHNEDHHVSEYLRSRGSQRHSAGEVSSLRWNRPVDRGLPRLDVYG